MEKEIRKINSLLRFYYKEKVIVTLKLSSTNNFTIRGEIINKRLLPYRHIIIKGKEKAPIKIFLEEILPNSIIPLDYEKKENKNNRSSLPKALRHKILKRDRFTCQACGARSPDVELEVDHKLPVSRGGTDEESNLTTLCKDCNRGKRDRV